MLLLMLRIAKYLWRWSYYLLWVLHEQGIGFFRYGNASLPRYDHNPVRSWFLTIRIDYVCSIHGVHWLNHLRWENGAWRVVLLLRMLLAKELRVMVFAGSRYQIWILWVLLVQFLLFSLVFHELAYVTLVELVRSLRWSSEGRCHERVLMLSFTFHKPCNCLPKVLASYQPINPRSICLGHTSITTHLFLRTHQHIHLAVMLLVVPHELRQLLLPCIDLPSEGLQVIFWGRWRLRLKRQLLKL